MNPENHLNFDLFPWRSLSHIIIAIFKKFPNNKRFQALFISLTLFGIFETLNNFLDSCFNWILCGHIVVKIALIDIFVFIHHLGWKWQETDAWDLGATLLLSLLCKIVILSTIPTFHVASTVMNGNDCYWKWQRLFKMATNALTNSNGYLQKGKLRSHYPVER